MERILRAAAILLLSTFVDQQGRAACPVSFTSEPTDYAGKLPVDKLNGLLVCTANDPLNDQSPCNTFAGKGLEQIYGVHDFATHSGYMNANDIWAYVNHSDRWVSLGGVFSDSNNLCAQALSNRAYPVVAVMSASGHGHIALVIPGSFGRSPTWGITAANSASFLYKHPESAYVGGMLSKAFRKDDAQNAVFFYRKLDGQP